MTVEATTRRAGPYTGNGVSTSFGFAFKVFSAAEVKVVLTASGVDTPLLTGYTVTLNADQKTNPGGSVTYPISGAPMPSTRKLTILSATPLTQGVAFPEGGNFRASVVEDAVDRATILIQQLAEQVTRTLKLPASASTDFALPVPTPLKAIGWNSAADNLVNLDLNSGIGTELFDASVNYVVGTIGAVLRETVRVKDFPWNAKFDYVTDDTAAIQAALNTGLHVEFPTGGTVISTVYQTTRGQKVWGKGMGNTDISLVPGGLGFVLGARNVSWEEMRFVPSANVPGVQSSIVADCFTVLESGNVENYIEGVKISRIMFENFKGCAIRMISPLRESYITQCRFKAMGNPATGDGHIHMNNPSTSSRSPNNLWITECSFYQAGTPFINFAVTGSSASGRGQPCYADIFLLNNLFHGQLLDETAVPPPYSVRAMPTEQVYIKGVENLIAYGNKFTACHPNYAALRIDAFTAYSTNRTVKIHHNFFSYNDQAITNPSGSYVRVTDCIDTNISDNTAVAGYFSAGSGTGYDFDVRNSGAHSSELKTVFDNNQSFNQFACTYNYPANMAVSIRTPERTELVTAAPLLRMRASNATARWDVLVDGSGSAFYEADPTGASSGSAHNFRVDGVLVAKIDANGLDKALSARGVSSPNSVDIEADPTNSAGGSRINFKIDGSTRAFLDADSVFQGVAAVTFGSQMASGSVPNASFFIDSLDGVLKFKNAAGVVKTVTLT